MRIFAILLAGVILASGCIQQSADASKYCEKDSDCSCGRHITTGECFYGNRQYVDTEKQCPDFCDGIGANLKIACVNKECRQVSA